MEQIRKFGELLEEGIQQERLKRRCKLGLIRDEICHEVGCGSTTLHTWRKGKSMPQDAQVIETLARRFVRVWQADKVWVSQFLQVGGYEKDSAILNKLLEELFGEDDDGSLPQIALSVLPEKSPSKESSTNPNQSTETIKTDSPTTINVTQSQLIDGTQPYFIFILGGIIVLLIIGLTIVFGGFFNDGGTANIVSTPEVIAETEATNLPESANHCSDITMCASFLSSLDDKPEKRFVSPIPVNEEFTGFYWNDRIEMISLPSDACVEIWEHDGFKGDSEIICNESPRRETFDLKEYLREIGPNKGKTWTREATSYRLWWIE